MDLVKEIIDFKPPLKSSDLFTDGVGFNDIDLDDKFLLVSQHPVTTEFGEEKNRLQKLLGHAKKLDWVL